jgi:two-component system torCAD operon response regulator TorR
VARLRRKLIGSGTPVIGTVTGVGYKLALSERL